MVRVVSIWISRAIAILAIAGIANIPERVAAQSPASTERQLLDSLTAMQKRLDQLEKQNQQLQDAVKGLQPPPPAAAEAATIAPRSEPAEETSTQDADKTDAAPKGTTAAGPPAAEQDGFLIGKNMNLRAVWTTGPGATGFQPWLETEDKAFRFHAGARIQPDYVFGAGADKNVQQGFGGTGPFLEGANMRRARLEFDGWMYENIDFFVEYEFANGPFNTGVKPGNLTAAGTPTNTQPFSNILNQPVPTDVWMSINYMPVLGTFRVGSLKYAIGLDHLTSSRFLDFMERSSGFDVYYNRNNGWENGFQLTNWTEDKRATYQATMTRTSNSLDGFSQGGDGWNYCLRLTWLPWYEDDGRYMMHLGLGTSYKGLDNSSGVPVANLNQRWLLRNSQANLQNVVALAVLQGRDQAIVNPEFFMNLGSLSVQSEFIASQVYDVTSFSTQLTPKANAVSSRTFNSQAFYVQALYFLTGEYRPYTQTALHGAGAAPTRVVPYRTFYWLHGDNGNIFSQGAWQVGLRYCYSTLDDGVIQGGSTNEITLGLNWFLNPNVKFQWNYDIGHRELTGGTSSGNYQGFGMRMAMDF
jgi:phosphate-selective porin OprO/OprP